MTGIELWSTTAASNNSAPPNGWPEGQAPSTVNDCARQMMASVRTWYENAQWINLGYTHTYVASTQFKISGIDVTSVYTVSRRVKAVGSSTGTIYGSITVSAFSTDTTITVSWDSGSLSNETLTIYVGITSPTNSSLPATAVTLTGTQTLTNKTLTAPVLGVATATSINFGQTAFNYYEEGSWTPADGSGATLAFSSANGRYTRVGRMVFAYGEVTYPSTANGNGAIITGLPFTCLNANYARQGFVSFSDETTCARIIPTNNNITVIPFTTAGVQLINSALSTDRIYFSAIYPVS